MASKKIPISVTEDLYNEIKTLLGGKRSFSGFVVECVKKELMRIKGKGVDKEGEVFSVEEKREILSTGRSIAQSIDESIASQLNARKNALGSLTDAELAKLAVSRLPKQSDESEQEKLIIDLKACINGLPGVEDICELLNQSNGEIGKLRFEYDILMGKYRTVCNRINSEEVFASALRGYFDGVYDGMVRYVCDMIARKRWSGFGDEGGERDNQYLYYSKEVERVLKNVKR